MLHDNEWRAARPNPNQWGWYSIYLPRRDRRLSWPEWLVTYRDYLSTRTHPNINLARRRVTTLIETNALPLSQATSELRDVCFYCRSPGGAACPRPKPGRSAIVVNNSGAYLLCTERSRSYECTSFVETQATALLKEFPVEFVKYPYQIHIHCTLETYFKLFLLYWLC